jgi:2-phosphosulfolactate phosphatase
VLLGERGGAKVEGCDLGNSPWDASNYDFRGKTMIHSTSAGTQGIVNAAGANASEIITGSLVNAKAIAEYIRAKDPETVSLIAMGKAGVERVPEDLLAAEYIRALLEGTPFDIDGRIDYLKDHGGEQFFDPAQAHIFPREDYPLCVAYDRFPFVLRVETGDAPEHSGRTLRICRVDPPFSAEQ